MEDQASSIVSLQEFKDASVGEPLAWGKDPRGDVMIHNSKTEKEFGAMPAGEGFFLEEENVFILCYEYYQGIALHIEKNESAKLIAEKIAGKLNANAFCFN